MDELYSTAQLDAGEQHEEQDGEDQDELEARHSPLVPETIVRVHVVLVSRGAVPPGRLV